MCLAVPVEVVEVLENERAIVDMGGVRKEISIVLLDGVRIGDFLIVHVGFALEKIDPEEAEKTLRLMGEETANSDAISAAA